VRLTITVDDKLKRFSENIIEKVQAESEKKINEFSRKSEGLLNKEKQEVMKEAEGVIKRMESKAEEEKNQIISKAMIDREHDILMKKKDILYRVVDDLKNMSADMAAKPEYEDFLKACIDRGLSKLMAEDVVIFFKPYDFERRRSMIASYLNNNWGRRKKIKIEQTDLDILGGCICENKDRIKDNYITTMEVPLL
jgi:vacuolar-type H+-ATPase subunit E/Vma4